ncbi:MAG TPA: HAD family phosphatase [Eudoraea sp.]|nr:HAD family phosphatase [Eudoraea sp.]
MVRNIIFDFGDVFINLDKAIVFRAMDHHGITGHIGEFDSINNLFEAGRISPEEFLDSLQGILRNVAREEIVDIWNSMLLDFPEYRLDFIERLAQEGNYRLFLLSNTNAIHIPHVAEKMGSFHYERFKNCFEGFYLSHEIHLRKPNTEIFEFVLNLNNLDPVETLFIDDTPENTQAAASLGIRTWHLKVGAEDIVDLKSKLHHV